jgi:Cu2+-exporting ATPase
MLPGRVRLRIPSLHFDSRYARSLVASLRERSGVREARANAYCGALIVSFDTRHVRLEDIEHWLAESIEEQPSSQGISRGKGLTERGSHIPELLAGAAATVLALCGAPVLAGVLTAVSALPVAVEALRHLRRGRVSVELLDSTAIAVMIAQRMPFGAALSATLIAGGEYIRSLTARRSRSALVSLFSSTARHTWILKDGEKHRVPAGQLRAGDAVLVYPGEQILVDGIVLGGKALVDQKVLTGESAAVRKAEGDAVFASTLVLDGKLEICAENVGRATRAHQIVQMLEEAPVHDTAIENYASAVAERFVLPALLLGGGIYAFTRNPVHAAAVIVFDLATAVRVSVPTTVLATMSAGVRADVLIKGGRALERLAAVDTIAFDKTGTLTLGTPRVTSIVSLQHERSENDVLQLAAALEQRFGHPAADAIVHAARERALSIPERDHSKYAIGEGVRASVNGFHVLVGSENYLSRKGVPLPEEARDAAASAARDGASTVFVAVDREAIGAISYQDVPRPEAKDVVRRLETLGMRVLMVTGDVRDVGKAIGSQLGIEDVEAEVFPEHKAEIVQRLQSEGRTVAVIGDGINDSPALAYADVSLSLKGGSDVARETADIVLHGDLHGLPNAIRLAHDAMTLIHQNLAFAGASNLLGIMLAAVGILNPTFATAINNGSAVAAAVNGLRPLRSRVTEKPA